MEVTPERAKKPPSVCLWGLLVSGGWSIGWPLLYAMFGAVPKNASFVWFTHAAAVVWLISLIAFFWTLAVLAGYSAIFSFLWDALAFLCEVLSGFL
jgi:hypothetical protein